MTEHPMMGCGHAANAQDQGGKPVCAICYGIHSQATIVADPPDLTGRRARCSYFGSKTPIGICNGEEPSSTSLAFFEYKPDRKFDSYYHGCWGWD